MAGGRDREAECDSVIAQCQHLFFIPITPMYGNYRMVNAITNLALYSYNIVRLTMDSFFFKKKRDHLFYSMHPSSLSKTSTYITQYSTDNQINLNLLNSLSYYHLWSPSGIHLRSIALFTFLVGKLIFFTVMLMRLICF